MCTNRTHVFGTRPFFVDFGTRSEDMSHAGTRSKPGQLAFGPWGKELEKALIQEYLLFANFLCLQEANVFECIQVTGSGLTFSEIGVNEKRDFGIGLMKQELDY